MVHCNNIHGRSLLYISFLVIFMIESVRSHTYLSSLIINGNTLPQYDGIRPHPTYNKEYPIQDTKMRPNGYRSDDMICGLLPEAARPANRKITIAAGSEIGLQWWHNNPGDDVLARSHKGPCMVYMAKSETGAGNVWFKIFEKGYDHSKRRWCTDDMIDARGKLTGITIPVDISPGNYLLRGELIGLHEASARGGAQPYVHCAELTITGSGTANPPGVAMNGLYTDAATYIYLYAYYDSFTIPGPKVYVPGSIPSPQSSSSSTSGVPSVPQTSSSSSSSSSSSASTSSSSSSGVPSVPQTSSSSTSSSTTGSSQPPVSVTSTTSGTTSSPPPCRVSISQLTTGSWTENGNPTAQYNVVMTNAGSSAVDLKFRLSATPSQMWNIVANSDGTYSLPSWVTGGSLHPGQAYNWGYIVRGNAPLRITLVVPSCDA